MVNGSPNAPTPASSGAGGWPGRGLTALLLVLLCALQAGLNLWWISADSSFLGPESVLHMTMEMGHYQLVDSILHESSSLWEAGTTLLSLQHKPHHNSPFFSLCSGLLFHHTGAGPRHFVFDPREEYAFALGEMDATITVFAYRDGMLNPLQTISTLPLGAEASPSCAEIAISSNGRFVYASNRGHDTIARFSFADGSLSALGHTETQGKTPRDFAIDPTDTFLIVGNQDSDTVVTFRIDRETGDLEPTGHIVEVPSPVCILPVQS